MGRFADLIDKYREEKATEKRLSTVVYANKHNIDIDIAAVAMPPFSPGDTNLRTTNLTNLIAEDRAEEVVSSQAEVFDMARAFFKVPPEDREPPIPKAPRGRDPFEAEDLGLVATWSGEFGFIAMHDPTSGEWHDFRTADASDWAVREARKRKELYRAGKRNAYRLTSREMGKIWAAENWSSVNEGIVEDHPIEEED